MNTVESVLFQGLSNLVRQNLLPAIVQYLASRSPTQGQVTVEELASVLKLDATTNVSAAPQQLSSTSIMPSFSTGVSSLSMNNTGVPALMGMGGMPLPVVGGAKKGNKKGTTTAPPPDHERCQYVFTRGRNKNDRCPNRSEPGQHFCSSCKSKKTAQQQLTSGAPTATGAPGIPSGLPGVLAVPGVQTFLSQFNPSGTSIKELPKLQVNNLADGLYHEIKHNLVIKSGGQPGTYICCGAIDPKTNQITPLTADKIEVCKQIGLTYVDPNKGTKPADQSAPVSVSGQILPNVHQQTPAVDTSVNVLASLPSVGQQKGLSTTSGIGTLPIIRAVTDTRSADEPIDDDDEDDDGDD
jgi:hypothetical protein